MFNLKKTIGFVAVTLGLVGILVGCAGEKNVVNKKAAPLSEVKITYVKSPLNIPSIVDKNNKTVEKAFEKDKIKVSFPDINSGAKQTEALAAGSLDICSALGGTSAILAASNGVALKIIGIYSRAPKAFNIMVKDDSIKSPMDLKGKKIAGPKGTILHQILISYLDKANLKQADVDFVSLGISESVNALMTGNADVALVAGADVLRAEKAGARVLANGEGLVDATIVTAVSTKFLKEHPEAVKTYMAAMKENNKFMKDNEIKAYEFTAKETGLKVEDVKVMAPWYNFNQLITEKDITELEKTQDFLLKTGLQKNKIDLKPLFEKL